MSHGSGARRLVPATGVPAAVLAAVLAALLAACVSGAGSSGGAPEGRPSAAAAAAAAEPTKPAQLLGATEINGYFLPVRYTAVDGDTWEGIASHFRMTPEILKSFNESVSIAAGQEIDLRGVAVPQLGAAGHVTGHDEQGRLLYRAGTGDTPAGIASRYGVPLYALRIANLDMLTGVEWIPPAGATVTIPNAPTG